MSVGGFNDNRDSSDSRDAPEDDIRREVESYETESGDTMFYETENPLAWIRTEEPVDLDDCL
ncbi:MAG: hypothetical protein SV253_10000 [Halobacteria archaeon]|nr:hypothetical protein [Halobacteria archaeon]